jgi:precorrin-8X/cobalt-precorrin-8 methylmutase
MYQPGIVAPASIEERSFEIIDEELSPHFRFTPQEHAVVRRVIHATADFEYARMLRFHPGCFEAFNAAVARGARVVCDVQMVHAGISKARLGHFGCPISCPIGDEDVAAAAKAAGHTRAIEAMRKVARQGDGGILAIGNAPTALAEAIRLVAEEGWRPDLIIGMPVGFVSAAESKDALAQGQAEPVPHITTLGRKGGSPAVVATVNALLLLAEGKSAIKG